MSTTTQATHTPGPWIFTSDGDAPMTHSIRGANRMWVAEIHDTAGTQHEVLANARLIAAAPELLHALQQSLWYAEIQAEVLKKYRPHGDSLPRFFASIEQARAAIAKATGENTSSEARL